MLSIYSSTENKQLIRLEKIEPGCWINLIDPSDEELVFVSKNTNAPMDFLRAALDEEETSRIDIEDCTLIILDIPFTDMDDNSLTYDTYPIAMIHTDKVIITVCLKNSKVLSDFAEGKISSFFTFKRSRFMLQILYRIANYYLIYLRQIDKKSYIVEKQLHKTLRNKELIQLLALEKSLVYFSTSLKGNEITLEKMLKLDILQKYEEDKDVLEDVIIENRQAIEMCTIYSNILNGTMDAYASVISNKLNIVMKFLAAITIVMAIPNMISGLFGMNVKGIPLSENALGFWYVFAFIGLIVIFVIYFLNKKDMF
ncbi:magnesium transporter CorA family protein [Clostridium lacusfryxellense]|uniref:magnesium transporter CorA family protein n=1 Tax=Clostridium lacusfryxellense TaxID=205328 RepID=UPI001C0BA349|nr:magnesium transporter CorA family protein [Clostridium lacusfryxellense]MBU3110871.1 magnesium transporter CorA family protein [Clostridium lacusfryxellense]